MRVVEPDLRDPIMSMIRTYLSSTPFYFKSDFAQILSGEEEAAFGWFTLNALRGSLGNGGYNSVGFLDLGGASMQMTFLPSAGHHVLADFYPFVINGTSEIRLYAKSKKEKIFFVFICFFRLFVLWHC
jgi:Golgi nucleoside diphosphatase